MATNMLNLNSDGYSNQVFALDGQLGIGELGQVDGFIATSSTPDLDQDKEYSYRLW